MSPAGDLVVSCAFRLCRRSFERKILDDREAFWRIFKRKNVRSVSHHGEPYQQGVDLWVALKCLGKHGFSADSFGASPKEGTLVSKCIIMGKHVPSFEAPPKEGTLASKRIIVPILWGFAKRGYFG